MLIDIDIEDFEKLMARELTTAIEHFKSDVDLYEKGGHMTGIFSIDQEEDLRQIKKMVKAMKRVRSWYSVAGTYDE
jgi:hypothetical protein